jgi:hypothetical protein
MILWYKNKCPGKVGCAVTNLAELAQKTSASKYIETLLYHSLARSSDCLSSSLVSGGAEGTLEDRNATSLREGARTCRAAISRAFRRRNDCADASNARTRNSRLRSKVGDTAPSRLHLVRRKRMTAIVEEMVFARNVLCQCDNLEMIWRIQGQWRVCRRSRKSQSRCRAAPPPTAAVIAEANPVGRNSLETAQQKARARVGKLFGRTANAKTADSNTGLRERERQREYVRSAICRGWPGSSEMSSMTAANVAFHDGGGLDGGVIDYPTTEHEPSKYQILKHFM